MYFDFRNKLIVTFLHGYFIFGYFSFTGKERGLSQTLNDWKKNRVVQTKSSAALTTFTQEKRVRLLVLRTVRAAISPSTYY